MKRVTGILALLLMTFFATSALAATHAKGGLGFHHSSAPIGIRWWNAGQSMAFDFGVGFSSNETTDSMGDSKRLNDFAVEFGVPFVMKSWDAVHILFRPGILFDRDTFSAAEDDNSRNNIDITAEIEGEVFLADNFSVSASHGVGVSIVGGVGDADGTMHFGTMGGNFTDVGFHMYFFGGE